MVERHPHWWAEAVWNGKFEEGGIDRTDLVFGSGGRVRAEEVVFVSSGSTVDRIVALESAGSLLVSNSLACLMRTLGAHLDASYSGYHDDFGSIACGLNSYQKELRTSAGAVQLIYFHNLKWDGFSCEVVEKPNGNRNFLSFREYHEFLRINLRALAENMGAAGRGSQFQPLSTLSSGYDAATVTVLAGEIGVREVVTMTRSTSDRFDDSGEAIAKVLGLQCTAIDRNAWRTRAFAEVPFLAADGRGGDAYFSGFESKLKAAVLLTGYHGDKVWDPATTFVGSDLQRGDRSGLSLTEYRLLIGFIHCPVPFMGARNIRSIVSVSHAEDMAPFTIPGGYSRPICRRIVEGAGVPRHLFGQQKKAASVHFFRAEQFLSGAALQDFQHWLAQHRAEWPDGRFPQSRRLDAGLIQNLLDEVTLRAVRGIRTTAKKMALSHYVPRRFSGLRDQRFDYVFPWALNRLVEQYSSPVAGLRGLQPS